MRRAIAVVATVLIGPTCVTALTTMQVAIDWVADAWIVALACPNWAARRALALTIDGLERSAPVGGAFNPAPAAVVDVRLRVLTSTAATGLPRLAKWTSRCALSLGLQLGRRWNRLDAGIGEASARKNRQNHYGRDHSHSLDIVKRRLPKNGSPSPCCERAEWGPVS